MIPDKEENTIGGMPNPPTARALFDENWSVVRKAIGEKTGKQFIVPCGANFIYGVPAISCALLVEMKAALGERSTLQALNGETWLSTLPTGDYYVSTVEQAAGGQLAGETLRISRAPASSTATASLLCAGGCAIE